MDQLVIAILLSIGLIFLILMVQFGDLVHSLLVLVAIPLGLIGVCLSLFIFRSTLSLNSMLGVILLNGIAVANSIILVDFLKQRVNQGLAPAAAALEAAKKRVRPILITSLTTVLGMLPIALGLGEGGRILQPLGIAVSGGLWVSMGLTLFIVPALQVRYLQWCAE
jgi:HAE1 family hydrophobic/amphiphilic exporter-1